MPSWIAACAAPLIRPLIFHPRDTRVPVSETDAEFHLNGVTLRGWVTNPGARRALIHFGGNAAQIGMLREFAAARFPDHATYLIAYRGYGASDGRPSERALVADGCALFDEVARRHAGAEIAIWGQSLGSAVAAQVAARRPAASRLILVTPFDSAIEMARDHSGWLPIPALMIDRFDSASVAGGLHMPTLVLRAGKDTVVLPARTDALIAALPPGVKVVDFPDADHQSIMGAQTGYWAALQEFLASD